MSLLSCLLSLLPALAPTAAGETTEPGIHFFGSYEGAFAEANARGVGLMIAVIQDDEEANDDVWAHILLSPEFVAASRRTVNLLGNRGGEKIHGVREIEIEGGKRSVCGRFGSVTCLEHQQCEIGIFRDFARDGVLRTPLVLFVLPDQTLVASLVDRNPLGAYLDAFDELRKRLPNGLDEQEARDLRRNLAHARDWLDAGEVEKVIAFAAPLRNRKTKAQLVRLALQLLDEVEERGRAEIEAAEKLVEKRRYVEAVGALESARARYRGTPVDRVAGLRLAALRKNREVRAALARAKREETARKLLEQADRWMERGKKERAEKLYERLRSRYADTDAARALAARAAGKDDGSQQ